jgi:hypothetical protein
MTTQTKTANSVQIGGDHYRKGGIQPWDYILANNLGYLEGTAIKYISRWKYKNGVEDLRKAIHFLEKLIEHYYAQEQAVQVALDEDLSDSGDADWTGVGLGPRVVYDKSYRL